MTMQKALITSRDPQGLHAVGLFEVVYNKSGLDKDRAQRLYEHGGELQDGIAKLIAELSASDRYADEEVPSSYVYPTEYKGPKPIVDQIKAIAKIFNLDPTQALEYAKRLPELPGGAEGWFAVPSLNTLGAKHFPEVTDQAEKYCSAVRFIHEKVAATRKFYNYRNGEITVEHLRAHARAVSALDLIAETQKGDILIIAAQLGMRHRGRSVRRAREVFMANEFGLGSIVIGSIALTHPERFVRSEELDVDCSGEEFSPGGNGAFSEAPVWCFSGDGVEFDTEDVDYACAGFGSASGFLSQ